MDIISSFISGIGFTTGIFFTSWLAGYVYIKIYKNEIQHYNDKKTYAQMEAVHKIHNERKLEKIINENEIVNEFSIVETDDENINLYKNLFKNL